MAPTTATHQLQFVQEPVLSSAREYDVVPEDAEHDAQHAGPATLAELVAEQTPGGMNEMVISEQTEDGAYASLEHSLDSIYSRLNGVHDPSLAPVNFRK